MKDERVQTRPMNLQKSFIHLQKSPANPQKSPTNPQIRGPAPLFSRQKSIQDTQKLSAFTKEPYERDYILQKRPIIWKSLLIVALYIHQRAIRIRKYEKAPYESTKEPY